MECPKKVFLQDLIEEIKVWQQEGNGIILMMDLNGNVKDCWITQPL